MTFAVAKEAGASAEEIQEAAAIAMTVNATRIRNAFNSMAVASGIAPALDGAAPAAAPGKT
jgi:alkylhydroperoxidase/carboxymuconolactone decarboxylase family protein YurZ